MDLMGQSHRESWTLTTSLTLVSLADPAWDDTTPEKLREALANGTNALHRTDTVFGYDQYNVKTSTVVPLSFGFQTRQGGIGLLQITDLTGDPRGVKIRYKLAQSRRHTPATDSREAKASHRRFVRLVVDKDAMTFEGQPMTWDGVGALLEKVTDRTNTVLECAVTSDQITVQQQNEWSVKCVTLAQPLGFEYVSFIGIHPLGSRGTPRPD